MFDVDILATYNQMESEKDYHFYDAVLKTVNKARKQNDYPAMKPFVIRKTSEGIVFQFSPNCVTLLKKSDIEKGFAFLCCAHNHAVVIPFLSALAEFQISRAY